MNFLLDFIFFNTTNKNQENFIKIVYESNPEEFSSNIDYIFDLSLRKKIYSIVGIEKEFLYSQQQINDICKIIGNLFHENISNKGKEYLINRNITEEQINRFKLGDTSLFINKDIDYFISLLEYKFPKQLIIDILMYHHDIICNCKVNNNENG